MNSLGLYSKCRLIKIDSVKVKNDVKCSRGPAKEEKAAGNVRGFPFRSCICYNAGEILIDLLNIDKSGKVFIEKKYRISNDSFEKYMRSCVLNKSRL